LCATRGHNEGRGVEQTSTEVITELGEYEHVNKKARSEGQQEQEAHHGKEPPQIEVIVAAQLKAQEVLKRREALLEGSTPPSPRPAVVVARPSPHLSHASVQIRP
jgi:hypothetical protein